MANNPRAKDNLNKGGTLGNKGGRPTDVFNAKCRAIADKNKLVEFWADVMSGKDFEQGVNTNGEVIKIPAGMKDRLKASELLANRAYGMPIQQIESKTLSEIARTFLIRATEIK